MKMIMNELMNLVYQISVLMIFKSIIINFIEGTKYEKHVRFASGFFILLLVFSFMADAKNNSNLLENIVQELEINMENEELIRRFELMDEQGNQAIFEAYEELLGE